MERSQQPGKEPSMRELILVAALLAASGCASQAGVSSAGIGKPPPPYAPVVNDAVARYHRCLGYEMGGFLETGGNAQEIIDRTIRLCEVELERLDGDLFARKVAAEERQTVLAEAEAEARDMLTRHLQEVLAEQS